MPERKSYSREQIESVLTELGYAHLQTNKTLVMYQNLQTPDSDLVFDWSIEKIEWEDLKKQLEFNELDYTAIQKALDASK